MTRDDLTESEAEALRRGGFVLESTDFGPEDPLVSTVAELADVLRDSLPVEAIAERLGIKPRQIRQRLTSSPPTLYGIHLKSGWMIPEFQLDGSKLIPGIAKVVSHFDAELHPVAVYRWFTTPNPDLVLDSQKTRALSPRDWLRLGHPIQDVVDLATHL